ncbi:enoyl-CoA hydratase/isomerase family protein [Pseudonocardia lacus]|uniref:enoyl-CoA hydratase/isomerase family protein n=1 Tax=Pseudonocardia lacus TaxID=2835865 RepID=UPI001BDD010F|nr:enoyl-CoA hydratase/isomerase family protein [Pseudonocardia lacus]
MREIRYDRADGVATVTIDRPEKRGAMTYAMLGEFGEAVARAGADPDVRVLLVTGVPGSFCSGIDLADLAGRSPDERGRPGGDGGPTDERGGRIPLLVGCPKPVVAAVDGMAVGMGAEFATQADLRIVSDRARFRWNFVHRGLVSDTGAGTWLLPRQIGLGPALRLLYTGEDLGAREALALGFATAVVTPEELPAAAAELAARIAASSPFAVARTKQLALDGLARDLPEHVRATGAALAECFASADHAEGVAAFLERRPAQFTGR